MKQVFKVESVDFVDMTAVVRGTTEGAPSIRLPIDASAVDGLVAATRRMLLEIDESTGSVQFAERVKEEPQEDKAPPQGNSDPLVIQPLTAKEMKKRGITSTLTMAAMIRPLLGEHQSCDNNVIMKVISKVVFPKLEELGIVTGLHERVYENGRPAKCRYFTKRGAEYGQAKSLTKDKAGNRTISTGYQFYENKKDEIIQMLGEETISEAKTAAKLME